MLAEWDEYFKDNSWLKIAGDAKKCNDCGACEKICPTDIRIIDYIKNGQRILSTECILCFECENVCVPGALKATWGFDCGTKELLNMKKQRKKYEDPDYEEKYCHLCGKNTATTIEYPFCRPCYNIYR
ncbi:4Fe-4S dicluster domain-containing protein [Chloroflexota bacterium]